MRPTASPAARRRARAEAAPQHQPQRAQDFSCGSPHAPEGSTLTGAPCVACSAGIQGPLRWPHTCEVRREIST
jgi:hypothetical protein